MKTVQYLKSEKMRKNIPSKLYKETNNNTILKSDIVDFKPK